MESPSEAHRALVEHQPVRRSWWLRLLPARCRLCGERYPCPPLRHALDELAPPPTRATSVYWRLKP